MIHVNLFKDIRFEQLTSSFHFRHARVYTNFDYETRLSIFATQYAVLCTNAKLVEVPKEGRHDFTTHKFNEQLTQDKRNENVL